MGLQIYIQDYDQIAPMLFYSNPSLNVGGPAGYEMSWKRVILPYLTNIEVFRCPSNRANRNNSYDGVTQQSYVANSLSGPNPPMTFNKGVPIVAMASPAQTILATEMTGHGHFGTIFQGSIGVFTTGQGLAAFHSVRAGFIFADGHVKPLKPLMTVDRVAATSMWSVDNQLYPNTLCGNGPATYIDCLAATQDFWERQP